MDMSLNKLLEILKDREVWCVVCSSLGHKDSDTTEQLNSNSHSWMSWAHSLHWSGDHTEVC